MSSSDVIDALFDRTVDIVQSLPKSGPIQTSYEEKLALYSLYKQATEGNVTSKRPGMLDMLGRAKWDAWAQRKGMNPLDAKQLYVESMMRTLRKFADRPQARALIEELEAFSGDVAERVMRGALKTDDTSSEASSVPAPLRHYPPRATSDDEREDRLSSLRSVAQQSPLASGSRRPLSPQQRYSQSSSVEGASMMAAHGGRSRTSVGSLTPQGMASEASDRGNESSDDNGHEEHGYSAPLPPTTSMRGPAGAFENRPIGSHPCRFGPPRPPSSTGGHSDHPSLPLLHSQRPGPVSQGLYASTGRFGAGHPTPLPLPQTQSGSNAGGGFGPGGATNGRAGASLYSTVGPSRPIEHHYYYGGSGGPASGAGGTWAPSSIGGHSNSRRPAPVPANSREIDQALQSIQASLAGLHERLNRVESGERVGRRQGGSRLERGSTEPGSGALGSAYRAVINAAHDIAVLLGIASPSSSGGGGADTVAAPTFGNTSRVGGVASSPQSMLRAPLTLVLAMINLVLRLTLDLTSLSILLTVLLFLFRRITGRGDPLILLRLARRMLGRRAGASEQAAVVGATAAAAAVASAAATVAGSNGVGEGGASGGGAAGSATR